MTSFVELRISIIQALDSNDAFCVVLVEERASNQFSDYICNLIDGFYATGEHGSKVGFASILPFSMSRTCFPGTTIGR